MVDVRGVDLRARPSTPEATSRRLPRRRTLLVAAAGAVVLALLLTWVIAFSPLFGVRTVRVDGAASIGVAQVERVADIEHGTPLVRLDTAGITRRVESIPEVESAQVSTSFPSTVTITVVTRHAVGYVRHDSGGVLVDHAGVQYRTVTKVPKGLPRFVLPTGAQARPTAVALGRVAASLTPGLRRVVTSIQALDPSSVTLTVSTDDGDVLVRWGDAASASDDATRARVLPVLLAKHPDLIDLTDAHQPFIH